MFVMFALRREHGMTCFWNWLPKFPQGRSSIGRVTVSKTVGWGFEALRPCHRIRCCTPKVNVNVESIRADRNDFSR